jgi:hypothetical protein
LLALAGLIGLERERGERVERGRVIGSGKKEIKNREAERESIVKRKGNQKEERIGRSGERNYKKKNG